MAFPHDGKKMKKGETLNPNGRPLKLVHHINAELKAEGYEPATNSHIMDAFSTLINLPLAKIAAIANKDIFYKNEKGDVVYLQEGDNYPMLYRLVAKELIGKRGGEYLEKVLDRAFGKAKQSVEHSGTATFNVIMENSLNCEPMKDGEQD